MPAERPLARLPWATAGVAPLRFALAGAGAAVAAVVDAGGGISLGFLLGALATTVAVLADPRRRFFGELPAEPPPPPVGASRKEWRRTVLAATVPSSLGLVVLAGIALAFSTTLAALLAGGVAGLGVAGLVAGARISALERRLGGQLLFERKLGGSAYLER
jgi:hypothetical protein